jgi:hypothetical protein
VSFALSDFGLTSKDMIIEDSVWQTCKDDLVRGRETWGIIEIGYRPPDNFNTEKSKEANRGKIKLTAFKIFCPYTIDIEYYKNARNEFSASEWTDVLLGAIDYNANGYSLAPSDPNDYINKVDPEEKTHYTDSFVALCRKTSESYRTRAKRNRQVLPVWPCKPFWLVVKRR